MVGAVVDVEFAPGGLPAILDALEVQDFDGENVEAALDVRLKGSDSKHPVCNQSLTVYERCICLVVCHPY